MATGMVRGFGPRAMAGLGAAQQQEETLERVQGRDQDQNRGQVGPAARAPEADTGRVVDTRDGAEKVPSGQDRAPGQGS